MSGDFVCQDDFMSKILSGLLSMKNILNIIQAGLFITPRIREAPCLEVFIPGIFGFTVNVGLEDIPGF